jgi:hypothetical protein
MGLLQKPAHRTLHIAVILGKSKSRVVDWKAHIHQFSNRAVLLRLTCSDARRIFSCRGFLGGKL